MAVRLLTPAFLFQWEIFRISHKALARVEWNTNRALLHYPGLESLIWDLDEFDFENDLLAKDKNFQEAFFERREYSVSVIYRKCEEHVWLIFRGQDVVPHLLSSHGYLHEVEDANTVGIVVLEQLHVCFVALQCRNVHRV